MTLRELSHAEVLLIDCIFMCMQDMNVMFIYFPNDRFIDYLSLTMRPIKIKYYNYTINTISTINNIQGKYESPNSKE